MMDVMPDDVQEIEEYRARPALSTTGRSCPVQHDATPIAAFDFKKSQGRNR
jgi:hypothetical protein